VPVGGWSWVAGRAVDPGDGGSSSELRLVALLCCPGELLGCPEESAVSVAAVWSYTRLTLVSAGPEAVEWEGSGVAVGGDMPRRSRAVLSLGSAVSPALTAELDVELGADCGAGRARRAGVGDSGEDDAEAAGWAGAWVWASVAEDGGEDLACRSGRGSESVSAARPALPDLGVPDVGGGCAESDDTAAAVSPSLRG